MESLFHWLVFPKLENCSWFLIGWKLEQFNRSLTKVTFFQHSQPFYNVLRNEIKNIKFVQGVNFEFIGSLKNNGTKYFLIIGDSCEEICNWKAFVDIANAGRHRGLSTIYIKHNFFHQSKLGRDFDLQNTHIVPFKSPLDLLQVNTLGAQMGHGSELVDWYGDATSVPVFHLFIDLSTRTDVRWRHCTNSASVPSKLYLPERLKPLRTLDDEHTNSL